jgi:hypothetical protein
MFYELVQFLFLWFLEVLIFSTLGALLFNDNKVLYDFMASVLYYFDVCLGNLNTDAYCHQE